MTAAETSSPLLDAFYIKPIVWYLATALFAMSTVAGPAEAMFVPAAPYQDPASREADMARIQTALESKVIQQTLKDYGLSPEETMSRVSELSDEQVHQLASHTDSLQAGGDAGGFIVGLVVVALLVVLLIYLVQGRVVVK